MPTIAYDRKTSINDLIKKGNSYRDQAILNAAEAGATFTDLADKYDLTAQRIGQIVNKGRQDRNDRLQVSKALIRPPRNTRETRANSTKGHLRLAMKAEKIKQIKKLMEEDGFSLAKACEKTKTNIFTARTWGLRARSPEQQQQLLQRNAKIFRLHDSGMSPDGIASLMKLKKELVVYMLRKKRVVPALP